MIYAVIIRCSAPNGRFCFSAARPERGSFHGHEAQGHPWKLSLRAYAAGALSVLRRIIEFGSPGRTSAIFGGTAFARRQVIGGRAKTNVTPMTAESSWAFKAPRTFGVSRFAPHYGFLPALLQAGKQAERGFSDQFETSCVSRVHVGQQTTGVRVWRTQTKGIRNP